jgi:ABC-type nitrate/sulfonate/bicarbonate transport system permease component
VTAPAAGIGGRVVVTAEPADADHLSSPPAGRRPARSARTRAKRGLAIAAPGPAALAPALVLAALLGGWEAYVDAGSTNAFLPAPHAVAAALWDNAGLLAANLKPTAEEVLLGILLALGLGCALAAVIHLSPVVRRAAYPLAVGSQAVPIAVIAPLLVFWWGFALLPKLAVIVLICFFPVLVTTVDALGAVDPDQLKLLRTLDASRWQAFRFAELPAALPAAVSGARIAVTVAVIGAYIAESQTATIGPHPGLGREINADLTALQTPRAYAAAVVLFAFAIACFYALALAERRLAPWANRPRGDSR